MSFSRSGSAHLSEMGIDVWTPRITEVPKFQHYFFSDDSNKRTCCVVLKVGNEPAEVSAALLLDNMMLAVGLSRRHLNDSLGRENPKDVIEEAASLDEVLKRHTPDFLLLSGLKIHHLITDANEKKKSSGVLNLGNYDLSFYSIESLLELLENPVRKREAWQTLSKLETSCEKVETK